MGMETTEENSPFRKIKNVSAINCKIASFKPQLSDLYKLKRPFLERQMERWKIKVITGQTCTEKKLKRSGGNNCYERTV